MNIGTLTFHRACNYGGILQCFALIRYLRSIGYQAEVIDYRSPAIDASYKLIKTNSLKNFIASFLYLPETLKQRKHFKAFRENFIPISRSVFYKSDEISNKYDLCIIGSDQVWSPRLNKGFDSTYWGQFNGIKATYAASMGSDHQFSIEEYQEISKYLKNFNFLSTREDSLRDELRPLTDKKIRTVIDPTLLLGIDDYTEIAVMPAEKDFVFYYQMEYHPQSKDFVTNIAKQLGCKVITLMGPDEDYIGVEHIHKTVSQVNVQQFLGYILNARCVIASSFHGTALPIAMHKDFYFLANYESDRSENLLRHIGALDRMKKSTDIIQYTPVNYSEIDPKLDIFVKESKSYIQNCISNNNE